MEHTLHSYTYLNTLSLSDLGSLKSQYENQVYLEERSDSFYVGHSDRLSQLNQTISLIERVINEKTN